MMRPSLLTLATTLALAAPAAAQDLFLGSPTTLVTRGDVLLGQHSPIGACGGSVQSMTTVGDDLIVGTTTGQIYRWTPQSGFLGFWFQAQNDARSMASDGVGLLVGGGDGTIHRYDYATAQLEATFTTSGLPVEALLVHQGALLASSVSGIILEGDPVTGNLQPLGVCGNDTRAMDAIQNLLFVASDVGTVWIVDLLSGTVAGSVPIGAPANGLAVFSEDLVVGSTDGTVRRVDRFTGQTKASLQVGFPVAALALLELPPPVTVYCQGLACPCGNTNPLDACDNSTGFGADVAAKGSASVGADDLVLVAHDLPQHVITRFYMGLEQVSIPFGDGQLCAGAGAYPTFRFAPVMSGALGVSPLGPGIVAFADANFIPGILSPGSTWNFQVWFRDPTGPCGKTVNTSTAVSVTFGL